MLDFYSVVGPRCRFSPIARSWPKSRLIQTNPHVVRILPEVEGNAYDAFFVYPDELRASKRIAVFRDFLLSKVAGWEF